MSSTRVVRLDDFRSRRQERLRRALILSGWRGDVAERTRLLARAVELTSADRAVLFWVDDYRGREARIDRVLDLASDPPRTAVPTELIERAYEHGFPSLMDVPDRRTGVLLFPEAPSSSALVALGGDGSRSWFLLVDSRANRTRLSLEQRNHLMFLSGALSSLVQAPRAVNWPDTAESFEGAREGAFAGWGVLGDLAEGTASDTDRERINTRFLLSRLVKTYLDEGLWMDPDGLADQAAQVRSRLDEDGGYLAETTAIRPVLDALEAGDVAALGASTLQLGTHYEGDELLHAARDFLMSAFALAVHLADAPAAVDAAWRIGRAGRRAADWDGAFRWYSLAADLARDLDDWHRFGRVMDGLANAHRDRGNLPRARTLLAEALEVGSRERDVELQASVLHNLMTVETLAGHHGTAIVYGWEAAQRQPDPERRLLVMADLGGTFMTAGQYASAEECLNLVVAEATDRDVRTIALSGLTMVAASLGRRAEFEGLCRRMETEGWQSASAIVRGQVMMERGLGWAWLGEHDRAHEWLTLAASFAETHGIGKLILDTDQALDDLADGRTPGSDRRNQTHDTAAAVAGDRRVIEVQRELADLRQAAVAGA